MATLCSASVTAARSPQHGRVNNAGPLTFCDLSTFYGGSGGGIRTYHDAKLAWFASQRLHRYVLIYPGRRTAIERVSPTITIVTTRGVPVGAGYRLPIAFAAVRALLRELRADVVETGDPWFSGPLALWSREVGDFRGPVTSFFHGDPLATYVEPWAARRGTLESVRRRLSDGAEYWFYRAQQLYDLTLVSSAHVERALRERGIRRVCRMPFGADPRFLEVGRRRLGEEGARDSPARLLYAGRLQDDKGFDVVLDTMEELLRRPGVSVTIAGGGRLAARVERLRHPRLRYAGFVAGRGELAREYARHDVLLAPGPYETFGLAALEGLAAGLSVVGPRCGGTADLLAQLDEPCWFDAGDRHGFVCAVDDAIDGRSAARVKNAVEVASRYGTWADAIERQVETYCSFLSRSMT